MLEPPYNTYCSFHVGNGEGFEWKGYYPQFKSHLENIISLPENNTSSLTSKRIAQREQHISDHKNNPSNFAYNYTHSEQAILIYLMQKTQKYWPQFLPPIAEEERLALSCSILSLLMICAKDVGIPSSEQ